MKNVPRFNCLVSESQVTDALDLTPANTRRLSEPGGLVGAGKPQLRCSNPETAKRSPPASPTHVVRKLVSLLIRASPTESVSRGAITNNHRPGSLKPQGPLLSHLWSRESETQAWWTLQPEATSPSAPDASSSERHRASRGQPCPSHGPQGAPR